ncbi:MAG: phosphotransferase [Parvularcula sp.]|nr:phosphotransferase [Parvularcula sp.]
MFDRQISASKMFRNTIRPLHFSLRGRFIVFPLVDGIPMQKILTTAPFEQICEGPIKWLRDLHAKPVLHGKTYSLTQEIDETLDHPIVRSSPWLTELVCAWRVRAERLDPVPLSHIHGDFNPGNILISENDFVILDFDTVDGFGAALLDLAQFLAHVHLFTFSRRSRTGPGTWPAWRDRILCWYGQPNLIADPFLAQAVQSRRLRFMMRAFKTGNKVRIDLLGRKLAQVMPEDILDI